MVKGKNSFARLEILAKSEAEYENIAFIIDREDFLADFYKIKGKLEKIKAKAIGKRNLLKKYHYNISKASMYLITKYGLSGDIFTGLYFELSGHGIGIGNEEESRLVSGRRIKELLDMGVRPEFDGLIFVSLDRFVTREQWLKYYDDYISDSGNPDTRSRIVRDRDWYWLHKKKGNSYEKIAEKEEIHGYQTITTSGVSKAIKAYRKKLNEKIKITPLTKVEIRKFIEKLPKRISMKELDDFQPQ
jgi:hypothetical protein